MLSKVKRPDYLKEREQLCHFLENFTALEEGGQKVKKYKQYLQEIANRKRIVFPISLDDVNEHFSEEGLVFAIERNTKRYVSLFSDAIDTALPEPNQEIDAGDVFDIMMEHRMHSRQQQEQQQQEDDAAAKAADPYDSLSKMLTRRYEVRIIPRSKCGPVPLRSVKAKDLGKLVTVRGIVTRCSDVKAELKVATYICDQCGFEIYQEINGKNFMPLTKCPSEQCKSNNAIGNLHQQTRGSKFVKFQELRIQEMSDEVPKGNIPRSMRVTLRGELTRECSPGDSVTLSGIFLPVPIVGSRALRQGPIANTYLEAMDVKRHKKRYDDYNLTEEMIQKAKDAATDSDIYTRLAQSIAPEIYGHEDVKKALLLMLVGGVTKSMPDVKIRGDINICLMGDPGVAKSQLLRYIASLSPRGIYTTGKGSSGVGLTAAVIKDALTGELVLEGGALVLADNGICCIDEFDKMEEYDRTAIHEVMEQQTVSIAKAGITTSLNARTSVLAAANPAYGRYNPYRSPSENINLPAALLSRFDLLFLLLDKQDDEADMQLARHVSFVHQFNRAPSSVDDDLTADDMDTDSPAVSKPQHFDQNFIRAVIAHAKRFQPIVPRELTEYIYENYVEMRHDEMRARQNNEDTYTYTTPRTLLSILRLSQALARLRFSSRIRQEDVEEAMRLMTMSKISIIDAKEKNRKTRRDPISEIYNIIRNRSVSENSVDVSLSEVQNVVTSRGFKGKEFEECLREYEKLNIWTVDADRGVISFLLN